MIHAREDYNRIQDPAGQIPEDEPVRGEGGRCFAGAGLAAMSTSPIQRRHTGRSGT